jgi:hypothetical protein
MENTISVRLDILSLDHDPSEITTLTGLIPTKTWKKGELVSTRGSMRYKHNGWCVKSKVAESEDLDTHVESILSQIQSGWEMLTKVSCDYEIVLACHLFVRGPQVPAIHFGKRITKLLSEINAAIDVDIYVSSENDE